MSNAQRIQIYRVKQTVYRGKNMEMNPKGVLTRTVMLVALVTTLAAPAQRAHAWTIGGGPSDALDPRNPPFNAIPNDSEDDREKLQQWIDAGCASASKLLYLPPGDWQVTRRPELGVGSIGSLRIPCDGLTILGAGRASRIVMKGSGVLAANFTGPADWWVFDIRGSGVTIEGIAIDGAQRSNTGEQTHLIQLTGPARDVELRRLYLNHPVLQPPEGAVNCKPAATDPDFNTRMCMVAEHGSVLCKTLGDRPKCSLAQGTYTLLGWFNGGDCIRSLGEVATPVNGVTVSDAYAPECDRSFIALQRASYNFTITGNVTKKVSDQIIDQEPSGTGGIGRILITGNRLERGGPNAQGAAAISLTGNGPGAEIGDAMVVSNNILDGGIITFNVARISIEHNIINGQALAANKTPVIQVIKTTDSLRLVGNEIDRPATSGSGAVILASVHNSGWPTDVTMALNTIRQNTDGDVIDMDGVQDVTITGNTMQCNQPTAGRFDAIMGHGAIAGPNAPIPFEHLIVSQNRVRGRCKTLVRVAPQGTVPVGAVSITGNQTKGMSVGVLFDGNLLPAIKPRISDNLFEGTAPANFVKGPVGFSFNGENGPQP
jgi:hypothetical protein